MCANDLHVDTVAAVLCQLINECHLITCSSAVGIAAPTVKEVLRSTGPTDEEMRSSLAFQPCRVFWINDDLSRQRFGGRNNRGTFTSCGKNKNADRESNRETNATESRSRHA
jgi:hypothetical protein